MEHNRKRYGVLAAGMLIQLCAGIIYMWSIFKGPVAAYLAWNAKAAALTSSIMLAAFVLGLVLGGRAQDKLGPKWVVFSGSVLIGAGMMLTALVTSGAPWLVYVTYGVVAGLGVGTVYTATVSVIQKWFPDKRGFATGMMVAAFGFSMVIWAQPAKSLLKSAGVPTTFLLFGLAFLIICGISSLFIVNPAAQAAAKAAVGKQYTTKEMLSTGRFYLIAFSMLFVLPAYFILNPQFTTLGVARGLSEEAAVTLVMITSIASASGRLLFSWLSDLIGRKWAILGVMVATLAAVAGLITAQGWLFTACAALLAFGFGGSAGVYPAITADHFGTKNMGLNYGCVMVAFGTSALFFQLLANNLADGTDFTKPFLVAGGTCIIAIVLILLLKKPKKETV